MVETQTLSREEQLNIEAEILRHLWYEGQATPLALSEALRRSLPILYECLEDLSRRGFIYQFWPAPQGRDLSVYRLTHQTQSVIQKELQGYSRYKLKSFWDALKREERLWDTLLHA
jgi:predicted ArsR family transcriptional regulator